jgi:hypothetical protein
MKFSSYTELISELQQLSTNLVPFNEGIKQLGLVIPDNEAPYDHGANMTFESIGVTEEQVNDIGKDLIKLRSKVMSVTKHSIALREIERFLIRHQYSRIALYLVLAFIGEYKWDRDSNVEL